MIVRATLATVGSKTIVRVVVIALEVAAMTP